MAEYSQTLRRSWQWVAVCCLAGAAAGYGLARILPPQFRSAARIRIAGAPEQPFAVETMKATALSSLGRESLLPVLDRFSLYRATPDPEGRLQRLREHIEIQFVAPDGLAVSFTDGDEKTSRDACAAIAGVLLAAGNRPAAADLAAGNLLDGQLKDARKKLDEQQAKLADFRRKHADGLGTEGSSEAQRKLADLNRQLQATDAALKNAQDKRAALTEALFTVQPVPRRKPAEASPAGEALEQELAAKQAQLVSLQARYTPDHPDVVKLKTDIANLQKKIADAKQSAPPAAPEPLPASPAADTNMIQAQMRDLDGVIRDRMRDRDRIEQQIEAAQVQLAASPMLEIEYSDLKSGESAAKDAYDRLLAGRDQARQAAAAAAQRASWTLAAPPESARVFPNHEVFIMGGAGSGLLLGALLAAWNRSHGRTLRTREDVERWLGVPALAVIPEAGDEKRGAGSRDHLGTKRERMAS